MSKIFTFLLIFASISMVLNAQSQTKPNVIVIMADDLGYGDVGFNGSVEIPTPNIDRIASNGVMFTNGYTTYSVCGPSRAGFITGRYQQQFGFERNPLYRTDDPYMGLPHDEMTIAESVAQVGYTSGVIGKWHLGAHISNHPLNRGFDEFYGHLGGGHRYFPEDLTIDDSYRAKNEDESYRTWIMRNHSHEETDEYLTDEFSNEAVEFVTRHKDEPFFLYLSYNAPHAPMQAKPEDMALFPDLVDESNRMRKTYAAMVHAVDRGVGKVIDKLQELDIEENTIIFFLSDNGGPETKNASDNGILRGGKSDVWEGGYRVPFAMQWKNQMNAGGVYDLPVSSLDIFATLSALSGSPTNPDKPLDGVNLIPYLKGENLNAPHEPIHIRKFDQDRHAVRYGDYKLIYFKDNSNQKLFDLSTNITEKDGENLFWNGDFRSKRDELDSIRLSWESGLIHPRFMGLIHEKLVWANDVAISDHELTLNVNDTHQLSASISPNDAVSQVVEWSSNNDSVVSVDQEGVLRAKTEGYAVITARVVDRRQVFQQCVVKVGSPEAVATILLSLRDTTLLPGQIIQLSAVVGNNSDAYALEWNSNNSSVASVNENGIVITNSTGSAMITAKVVGSENVFAVCTINVQNFITHNEIVNRLPEGLCDWFLFPNPVSDILNFNFKSAVPKAQVSIYNAVGNRVYSVSLNPNVLSFQLPIPMHLNNGIYWVEINQGTEFQTKRFVLQRD